MKLPKLIQVCIFFKNVTMIPQKLLDNNEFLIHMHYLVFSYQQSWINKLYSNMHHNLGITWRLYWKTSISTCKITIINTLIINL